MKDNEAKCKIWVIRTLLTETDEEEEAYVGNTGWDGLAKEEEEEGELNYIGPSGSIAMEGITRAANCE